MTTTLIRKKSLLARVRAWLAPSQVPGRPPTRLFVRAPLPSSKLISEIFDLPPQSTSAGSSSPERKA